MTLSLAEFVELLRVLKAGGGSSTVDIQGSSGHAHVIELNFYQGLALLLEGSLSVESSKDAGHTYSIELSI